LYDDVCHDDANCKDTLGAYSCLCNAGYAGDGFDCAGISCKTPFTEEQTNLERWQSCPVPFVHMWIRYLFV
jgi:hypothetical protein